MSPIRRRLRGWVRLTLLVSVAWMWTVPWRQFPGAYDEPVVWTLRAVGALSVWVGTVVGELARDRMTGARSVTFVDRVRCMVIPVAGATAAVLVLLEVAGHAPGVATVSTAWVGYVLGFDLAAAAGPLCRGRDFAWTRGLEPDPDPQREPSDGGR